MAFNLLDVLREQVGDQFSGLVASQIGSDQGQVQQAIEDVSPSIVSALANKASEGYGAKEILDQIQGNNLGESTISDLTSALTSGNSDGLQSILSSGKSLVSNLFGGNIESVINLITERTGLSSGSAGSILNLITPLILGSLGKEISNNGLDATGLKTLLLGQKDFVKDLVPQGMSLYSSSEVIDENIVDELEEDIDSELDEAQQIMTSTEEELPDHVKAVEQEMEQEVQNDINIDGVPPEFGIRNAPRSTSSSSRKRQKENGFLQKTLAASGVAILGIFVWTTFLNSPSPTTDFSEDEFKTRGGQSAKNLVEIELKDGTDMLIGESSVESQMLNFINDYNPNLKDMAFKVSGDVLRPDSKQLSNIASILKSYPDIEAEVIGNTSMANDVKLGLIKQGVSEDNISVGKETSQSDTFCVIRLKK
ncbi:DUF937 domain-containing protein [Sediminitomix flava]|uniref:Uncharacterized protein DUF937 n=1 Tax=Sediminitomix flava TaxID=379075 RepID=A0A315ZCK7_SEDFL|nr:DUF937 domain-containing protein [Sediminitomix flava]PWJ43032.1 uncharacterized protein DUF937 [Sediminitomix flava]